MEGLDEIDRCICFIWHSVVPYHLDDLYRYIGQRTGMKVKVVTIDNSAGDIRCWKQDRNVTSRSARPRAKTTVARPTPQFTRVRDQNTR